MNNEQMTMDTLSTLQRQVEIAMDDFRAQIAICKELQQQVNANPSLAPVLQKANERRDLLEARWNEAGDRNWAARRKKFFS